MQKSNVKVLTHLLSETFDLVLKTEQLALSKSFKGALSISEIHTIEAIGCQGEKNARSMGEIAEDLDIAVATLTVAINKLEKKGYAIRNRPPEDRRVVLISLTRKGCVAFRIHQKYHKNLIESTLKDLDNSEETALINALDKLNIYFKNRLIGDKI